MSDTSVETTEETNVDARESSETTETSEETSQETQTNGETNQEDWRAAIEDENLRKHAERFQTPTDAVKNHLELRQKLSNAVFKPGENATEEEVAAFRKAIGVPESIEDYQIDLPEGMDQEALQEESIQTALKEVAEIAHEHNVPVEAFKALAQWDLQREAQRLDDVKKQDAEFAKATSDALKKEWGRSYDTEMEYANRGAEYLFGDDVAKFRELISKADDRPLGDHEVIIKALNKLGRQTSEDTVPLIPSTPEEETGLRQKLADLTIEQDKAMNAGDTNKAKALDEQIMEISRKIGGDAPI